MKNVDPLNWTLFSLLLPLGIILLQGWLQGCELMTSSQHQNLSCYSNFCTIPGKLTLDGNKIEPYGSDGNSLWHSSWENLLKPTEPFPPWAPMVASRRCSLGWSFLFCGKNKLWILDCNTTCGENGMRRKAISLLSLFLPPDGQVLLDPHNDAKNS